MTMSNTPRKHPEQIAFGRRVAALRKARGWSQQQLADRLEQHGVHLHQTSLSLIEQGERVANVPQVVAFASALEVAFADLLGPDPAPSLTATFVRYAAALERVEEESR